MIDKKKWLAAVGVIAVVVIVAVVGGTLIKKAPSSRPKATWQASLAEGTVVLTEIDGKTTVDVALAGTSSAAPMPAHIHEGACPKPGAIKYSLNNVVDGKSETTLPVTIEDLKKMLPLAVNIHKSAVEPQISVSCGDLK